MEQAVERFKTGARILLGEYRHGKCETINYRDKTTGKPASFTGIKHSVEVGEETFLISERVPDGYDVLSFVQPCVKGSRCVVTFDKFTITSGVGQFSGTVSPLVAK